MPENTTPKIFATGLPNFIQDFVINYWVEESADIEHKLALLGDELANCLAETSDAELQKILHKDVEFAQILSQARGLRGMELLLRVVRDYVFLCKCEERFSTHTIRDLTFLLWEKLLGSYVAQCEILQRSKYFIPILFLRDLCDIWGHKLRVLLGCKSGVKLAKLGANSPLVSLIIPVYNVEDYVEQCLESALAQSYKNLEIILVEDCSTDNSLAVVEKTLAKYSGRNVKLLKHRQNKGLGAARNTGIAQAEGEYIMFLDSDDYISRNYVQSLLSYALANDLEVVCGGVMSLDANSNLTYRENYFVPEILRLSRKKHYLYRRESPEDKANDLFGKTLWRFPDVAWAKLYHRRIFQHMRFPEGVIQEDFGFFVPTLTIMRSIGYYDDNKSFYFYRRQRDGSIMMDKGRKGKKITDIIKIGRFIVDRVERLAPLHLRDAKEIRLQILYDNIVPWLAFPQVSETICQEFHHALQQILPDETLFSYQLQRKLQLYRAQNLSWQTIFFLRLQDTLRFLPTLSIGQIKEQITFWKKQKMQRAKLDKLPQPLCKIVGKLLLFLGFCYGLFTLGLWICGKIIQKLFKKFIQIFVSN